MKSLAFALLSASFITACATSPDDTTGEPDVDDPSAKADGAAVPLGLYQVVEPERGFDEFDPYIGTIDLRSDGTFYDTEFAPVDAGDGNYEQGTSTSFGTYKLTKDSHGNRYIRFTDGRDSSYTWRWRFATVNGGSATLQMIYDNGDDAFRMKRETRPTATFLKHVKADYATSALTDAHPEAGWAEGVPGEVRDRADELGYEDIKSVTVSSFEVDDATVYTVAWTADDKAALEVFATSGQLIAKAKTVDPLEWADVTP